MQVKTILNRIEKYQSFVYDKIELVGDSKQLKLEVQIKPRRNSHPICSGCGLKGPGYDTLPTRKFEICTNLGYSCVLSIFNAKSSLS